MKCKYCNIDMVCVYCNDSGQNDPDVAFNIYCCDSCFAIAREDVWAYSGIRWIAPQYENTLKGENK